MEHHQIHYINNCLIYVLAKERFLHLDKYHMTDFYKEYLLDGGGGGCLIFFTNRYGTK